MAKEEMVLIHIRSSTAQELKSLKLAKLETYQEILERLFSKEFEENES